jgi:2-keto-3-deoxy-L-fuconate dehydrogenase
VNLDGCSALVTGGSSGIGRAVVDLLVDSGARVACLDLQPGHERALLSLACDISDEAQVDAAVAEATDALGAIRVAVLNAGVGGFGALVDLSTSEWDRVMGVNLRGTFFCLRAVGKAMVGHGQGGAIVAVTSISGFLADRMMGHYSASKAAVAEIVRVAARELGPSAIRVNAVAPGTTDTPMFAATDALAGYRKKVADRSALGEVGTAVGVAQAIVSVLQLDWVTGQVVAADGGVSLWSPIDPAEYREHR